MAHSISPCPRAIGPLRRQLLLARLFERSGWPIGHALRLADELAALLDELQTERVPLDALARLVPQHLAEHWQNNRAVLAVIAEAWPGVLAAERALDPAERRHRLLTELAALWRVAPPQRRIVAAGSTGSIPATRALLGAIATLPRGTVVLPGLDQAMDEASWRVLPPSHPQYGLKQLLEALEIDRAAVAEWAAAGIVGTDPARARLLGEAMRPAATIAAWQQRGAADTCGAPGSGAGTPSRSAGRSARPGAAHARRARGARAQRRPGHARPSARPPGRRRAAPLGHRGRRFRRHAARSDPARRLPAAHRAPGHRRRHAGRPARCAQAPVRAARPGSGRRSATRCARSSCACLRGPRLAGGFCRHPGRAPAGVRPRRRRRAAAAAPRPTDRVRRAGSSRWRARSSSWPAPGRSS